MREEFEKLAVAGKIEGRQVEPLVQLTNSGFCTHRSWGFGRIKTVDTVFARFTIDFPGKAGHAMDLAFAAESLKPIPKDHILARKAADLEGLRQLAALHHLDLIKLVINSYSGQATLEQIQQVLVPDVIRDDWKKWWETAKYEMKKDGHFVVPAKKSAPIEYQAEETSLLDRLLPFFASKAVKDYAGSRRPWFVGLLLATLLLRATGVVPTRIADLLVLALLGRQLAGWRAHRLLRVPMITVLLLAVGWLGLGYAVELVRGPGPASVHFWTVGGLCTLVLGIATRVTRGHGGLPVALDRWAALALLLVQGAAVLRALLPMVLAVPPSVQLFASAGLLGAAFLIWGFRHALLLSK